jgi:hypothetical protein
MQPLDDMLIPVQREWNGWRTADVRFGDLQNIHWLQPKGAPVLLVHGYILCTSFVNGNVPHECDRTRAPHRLLVWVIKRHIAPHVHAELTRRAVGPRPMPPNGRPQHNWSDSYQSF